MRQTGHERNRQTHFVGAITLIIAILLGISIVGTNYYTFLDEQLYLERSTMLREVNEQIANVVETKIKSQWTDLLSAGYYLTIDDIDSQDALLSTLREIKEIHPDMEGEYIAFDEKGHYYTSDGKTGHWNVQEMLSSEAPDQQTAIVSLPYDQNGEYMIFLERLEDSLLMEEEKQIVYFGSVIDMEYFKDDLDVGAFGDHCYTYIVNSEGRRLYKNAEDNSFIESYNILSALNDFSFKTPTSLERLKKMDEGETVALEFTYLNKDGKAEEWYVSSSRLSLADWSVMVFVPTTVLGAQTNLLIQRTIIVFISIAIAVCLMAVVIATLSARNRNEKRLREQQEQSGILLEQAAREAREASQAKTVFLSHMSHDIRTPINGIMGMIGIAKRNIQDIQKVENCLDKIDGASHHLLNLINDVLDMSRIESGNIKRNHAPFNLRATLEQCSSIIAGQLMSRDVEFIQDFEEITHARLIGDELHLRQIFINILGNSVKFTHDGDKILFHAKEISTENGKAHYRFVLEDSGIGMEKSYLPKLFDEFSQEDDGSRTTYKGTGLGMAITSKLVEMLDGTIEVESELNVGTRFTLEFSIDINPVSETEQEDVNQEFNISGMQILLAEDNELNAEIAVEMLTDAGAKVILAENGVKAVEAFCDSNVYSIDAILMDIMMPEMDGIKAAQTIRNLERPDAVNVPILAMTANAYDEDVRRTREAGMNEHLSKPIDMQILFETLAEYYKKKIPLKGLRVLMAEDNELNAEITMEILNAESMEITWAKDGQEAVKLFSESPPGSFDVILMDMNMPVMNGMEAAMAIRACDRPDGKTILILAMTANIYDEDVKAAKDSGMNEFLTKPLDIEMLQNTINNVLKG